MVKLRAQNTLTTLIITKVIYVSIWIALPIIIGITWWKVLIGFFVMHYTAGLILCPFQLAHVVEENYNPSPKRIGRNGQYLDSSIVHYNQFCA
jgi:linoleoyl-CoA desaturase